MRNAETILEIIRERGRRGLPLERIYRLLFNPELYLRAYGRLYRKQGAMTHGATSETVDAMSLAKIDTLIEAIRNERFQWTPVRRTYIPKANGKLRPLGVPTWSDKMLQEVIRSILEAYYEPQFSPHSHGFRPQRGCHTALREVDQQWLGTRWFVEADVSRCFESLDHQVLLSILQEKIHDNRLLSLIANLLKAGYLENWKFNKTLQLAKLQATALALLKTDRPLTREEAEQVRRLLLRGTSMGGARPKAVVEDEDGLWLAKFNRPDDDWNVARVEHAMLSLARWRFWPVCQRTKHSFTMQAIPAGHTGSSDDHC